MTIPQNKMETIPTSSSASASMYAIQGNNATTEASSVAPLIFASNDEDEWLARLE
jgi:hypothetical protein